MARDTEDRENLLRDAKAFVQRAELRLFEGEKPYEVFAGFRRCGALSLFFGHDLVYQFNTRGELRRAFDRERIIKAERGRLVGWLPHRTQETTEMLRQDLEDNQQQAFCQEMTERLRSLRRALERKEFELIGQAPEEEDIVGRLCEWLAAWQGAAIAESPRVS